MAGSVWDEVLDTEHAVVVRTYIEHWPRKDRPPEKVLIIVVEPDEETRCRCPECGQRGRPVETDVVRWRTLDVHGKRTFLESELPRIICGQHGKITAAVPWARHDDRFSRPFEEFAAWKAAHMPWTRAAAELRITWEALANITARVAADAPPGWTGWRGCGGSGSTRSPGARGRASTWSSSPTTTPGGSRGSARDAARPPWRRSSRTSARSGRRLLTHVSADGADWIHPVVREKAPQAQLCLDAFHVVKWAGEKLDELRRRIAGELRAAGRGDEAATLGSGMWALRKDQQKLTPGQRGALAQIAVVNKPLYKGYLIKEQIREAFKVKGEPGQVADARRDRLGAPVPHPRVHQARQDPVPVQGPPSRPPSAAAPRTAGPRR